MTRAAGTPPRGATPRVLLAAAVTTMGEEQVVAWCGRLILGRERDDDPDLAWLGGTEEWPPYWRRVWGTRGLLYVWDADALHPVATALTDEHWRVREMALKVVRAQHLAPLAGQAADLRHDENARVRSAAERALGALR